MQTPVRPERWARSAAGSVTQPAARVGWSSPRGWLQQQLPRLVLSPTVVITLVFVYGFILWTLYLSFTRSRGIPSHELVGWLNYQRVWNHPRWSVALHNLAVFGILYIALCLVLGLFIAILLDQRIRQEGDEKACAWSWAFSSPSSSTSASGRRARSGPSTSIRWHSPSSSPGPRGSGC